MNRKKTATFLISLTLMSMFFHVNKSRAAATTNALPEISKAMNEKYKGVSAISADFTQTQKKIAQGKIKQSKGKIFIRKPDKFRWETESPEPSTLVSNGKKVWFYTPPFREGESGQVMIKKAADVQSKLAVDLLSGQADLKKSFKSKRLSDGHFDLKPLIPAGDVARIELFLEKQTNLVYKVLLFTKTGNQTELVLTGVKVNPVIEDSAFQFVPPENTEEIQ